MVPLTVLDGRPVNLDPQRVRLHLSAHQHRYLDSRAIPGFVTDSIGDRLPLLAGEG